MVVFVNCSLCCCDCWFTDYDVVAGKCYLITTDIFTPQWKGVWGGQRAVKPRFNQLLFECLYIQEHWGSSCSGGISFLPELTWLWIGLVFGNFVTITYLNRFLSFYWKNAETFGILLFHADYTVCFPSGFFTLYVGFFIFSYYM